MTIKSNKTTIVTIILLAIIVCMLVWFNSQGTESTTVFSETGVWDLRGLPFENNNYSLDGQAEYIIGALLTPEEFLERESEAVICYPPNDSQYATSRMRILLPDDGYYTFSCRSIDYSVRLYVNGEWILNVGNPGDSKETNVPDSGRITLTLKPVDGVIEIIQQASNFVHRDGGHHDVWNVSGPELRASLTYDFRESMKLGSFLALFFVHIILFLLLRSYRANLYFALFCLMWFLRTGVIGAKIFTDIFPWMSWAVKFRIEYLAFPVTAVLLISLLDALFPGILHKWFRYALNGMSVGIAALFIFADTLFMSYALLWCEALYIPAIVYIVVRFVMKLRSVQPDQVVFLAGIGMFFYAAVHDMLYYNGIFFLYIGDISSISMLLLTFCEAAAVFIATVREMDKAKEQEWVLAVENAALKEHARMTEQQLILQREQYDAIAKNAEDTRRARHDLRHQLAVIKWYGHEGDTGKLNAYVDELTLGISAQNERTVCDNFAVNAVTLHYLTIAENEGIETSMRLNVPAHTGRVLDSDLCIIVGNFMENAHEAGRGLEHGKRFIKLSSIIKNGRLVVTMENSFDGEVKETDGVFYSRKRDGEGVGLSSVRAVAHKYDGNARFETKADVFLSSVHVKILSFTIKNTHNLYSRQ